MNNLKTIRNVLALTWLITLFLPIMWWVVVYTGAMQYFLWAMPGFTLESVNVYLLQIITAVQIVRSVFFMSPAIALHLVIVFGEKRKSGGKMRRSKKN